MDKKPFWRKLDIMANTTVNHGENGAVSVSVDTAIGRVVIRPYTVRRLSGRVEGTFKLSGIEYNTTFEVTPGPENKWRASAVYTRREGWAQNGGPMEPTDKARRTIHDILDS